jgi:glycerol uptake facilitator-like aquaporin
METISAKELIEAAIKATEGDGASLAKTLRAMVTAFTVCTAEESVFGDFSSGALWMARTIGEMFHLCPDLGSFMPQSGQHWGYAAAPWIEGMIGALITAYEKEKMNQKQVDEGMPLGAKLAAAKVVEIARKLLETSKKMREGEN